MIAFLAVACTGGSTSPSSSSDPEGVADPTAPPTSAPAAPTWWRDVQPVVATRCASCHQPGDIGPFPLTTYAEAAPWAEVMAETTASRTMPPWPPSRDCAPLQGDRTLSDAELALFAGWAEAGAPEGDPADASDAPEIAAFAGDLELSMTEDYTPLPSADDYRCFVVPWPEAEPTFATAYQVYPGARELVHHVILYLGDAGDAAAADAADPGPGYSCFGSAGITATMLGSWVPGVSGTELPVGTGVPIQPGSAVVVQVHYNTLVSEPRPDRTTLSLKLADEVQSPAASVLWVDPSWLMGQMNIPAGDADVVHSGTVTSGALNLMSASIGGFGEPLVLSRLGLHMHLLGTSTNLTLHKADGTEQCLLDIPAWDFHWQGGYNLVDPVTIEDGDSLELTCHWDNSAPDAIDVNWGEGTHDEMCLTGLYLTR